MAKTRKDDLNTQAFNIVSQATKQNPQEDSRKNPAAVALGRLGGLKGGKARACKLSPAKRKAIARIAAKSRWKKSSN
jgi:hypothetical protein